MFKAVRDNIPIFCIALGGSYILFGTSALIMVFLQKMMLSFPNPSPLDSFLDVMNLLHFIWMIFMPILIVLGLLYFLFGLFYKRIKTNKYRINLILMSVSFLWSIAYAIACYKYVNDFLDMLTDSSGNLTMIAIVFSIFGFLFVLLTLVVPQYFIGRQIRNQEISV